MNWATNPTQNKNKLKKIEKVSEKKNFFADDLPLKTNFSNNICLFLCCLPSCAPRWLLAYILIHKRMNWATNPTQNKNKLKKIEKFSEKKIFFADDLPLKTTFSNSICS